MKLNQRSRSKRRPTKKPKSKSLSPPKTSLLKSILPSKRGRPTKKKWCRLSKKKRSRLSKKKMRLSKRKIRLSKMKNLPSKRKSLPVKKANQALKTNLRTQST